MSPGSHRNRPAQALLGMGANLGNRRENLHRGIELLAAHKEIKVAAVSSIYESDPAGYPDQPRFYNLVAGVETGLDPEALLEAVLAVEKAVGRVRSFRNAPRTLDIDLLFYETLALQTDRLVLPHPRFAERPFVVVPLEEALTHPVFRVATWDRLRKALKKNPNRRGVTQVREEG